MKLPSVDRKAVRAGRRLWIRWRASGKDSDRTKPDDDDRGETAYRAVRAQKRQSRWRQPGWELKVKRIRTKIRVVRKWKQGKTALTDYFYDQEKPPD